MSYTKSQIEAIESSLSPIDTDSLYDSMLDEQGPVNIAGLEYDVSNALKSIDEIAYRTGKNDYLDGLIGDSITEEINGEYYDLNDVENLIEELETAQNETEESAS